MSNRKDTVRDCWKDRGTLLVFIYTRVRKVLVLFLVPQE